MCNVTKKLVLFDYTVEKLLEWQEKEMPELSRSECLQKFNFVRYMKLLYFICLESVLEKSERVEDTLFGVFGNFIALEKGPVEINVYSNRSILPRYRFDGRFLSEIPQDKKIIEMCYPSVKNVSRENIVMELIKKEELQENEKNIDYKEKIDLAIEALKKRTNFPFDSTNALVELSHQLGMWSRARLTNDEKLSVDNIFDLKKEKQKFDNLMQAA